MTQGIFIQNEFGRRERPKSKKAIREAVEADPLTVIAEATSWHGDEYDGPIGYLPATESITFCGPDPHNDRRFYGTIKYVKGAWKVV